MKGAEESTVTKIMVDLGFLLITNLLVAVKTCKVFNRHYDRMDVGGLAGCTGMFSQMLFVSFWYMLNIGVRYLMCSFSSSREVVHFIFAFVSFL